MEPEEKPKINWRRLSITIGIVLVTAGVFGGGVWYFMDQQSKKEKAASERDAQELQKQADDLKKADPTSDWKTFTNSVFSIKYPSTWVYKDYSALGANGANLVGFADTVAHLAPEQSDGSSIVDVRWGTEKISELTTSPDKMTTQTVTVSGGLSATKYTLLPVRPDDMRGESKIVLYEVKLANGKYLGIQNMDDNQADIFLKMVDTIK